MFLLYLPANTNEKDGISFVSSSAENMNSERNEAFVSMSIESRKAQHDVKRTWNLIEIRLSC